MAETEGKPVDPSPPTVQPLSDLKEYETQYFGFTPKAFIDGVYNSMVEYLGDLVEVTQKYFSEDERFKDKVSPELLQESSERLFVQLRDGYDKAFDRLESYLMKNIFHISSAVVLPEDEIHITSPVTESSDQKLDNELEELHKKIRNAQYVNLRLERWLNDVDKTQHILDTFLSQLQKWEMVCREANVSDLGETVAFVVRRSKQLVEQCKKIQTEHRSENNSQKEVMETD